MGIEVQGVEELKILLSQGGEKAVRGVLAQMRREAESIKNLAQDMAPLEFGNLEQAIKVREIGGGRGQFGQFERKSLEVYIDGDMPVPERPGKFVGDYAWEAHQHITPYGFKKLGIWSQAKQDSQSEVVGGGFMERAADKVSERMMNRLIEVAKDNL